jgi:hypothetical protein
MELLDVFFSRHCYVDYMKKAGWYGHVAFMGEVRDEHKIADGKSQMRGPLEKPMRKWEDNINMNI